MLLRVFAIAVLSLCFVAGIVRSEDDAASVLIAQLEAVEQLQGRFVQHQYGAGNDALIGVTEGRFSLLRPGYFAWEIEAPDRQLIVADPEFLWHYDRDLETVTRRPVSGAGATASPLQVLGGDVDTLRNDYQVELGPEGLFTLTPLTSGAGFQSLSLNFAQGLLQGMDVVDSLGQRLVIRFTEVRTDAGLGPADFAFTPPDSADLFYHEQ